MCVWQGTGGGIIFAQAHSARTTVFCGLRQLTEPPFLLLSHLSPESLCVCLVPAQAAPQPGHMGLGSLKSLGLNSEAS